MNRSIITLCLISDHKDNPGLLTVGKTHETVELILDSEGILLEYYYTPTCSSCREFLEKEIPLLEEKLNLTINVKNINITEPDGLTTMNNRLKILNSHEKKLPILIVGEVVLAGDRAIEGELETVLVKISHGESVSSRMTSESGITNPLNMTIIPIFLAGLLDGINPCAFSTLIFLLSWLNWREETGNRFCSRVFSFPLPCFSPTTPSDWGHLPP